MRRWRRRMAERERESRRKDAELVAKIDALERSIIDGPPGPFRDGFLASKRRQTDA